MLTALSDLMEIQTFKIVIKLTQETLIHESNQKENLILILLICSKE